MTDDATERGRTAIATTAADLRPLDPVLLGDIAARQLSRGIPADLPFVLLDVAEDGLHLTVVDPTAESVIEQQVVPTVRPSVLDHLLADHLVRTGRVEQPATQVWTAELLDLASRGRKRLASSDGTFIMGREHVKFFRVAQRDLDEASAGQLAEVVRLSADAGASVPGGVTSLVLAPGHEAWPGFDSALAQSAAVPVLALDAATMPIDDAGRNRHDSGAEVPAAADAGSSTVATPIEPLVIAASALDTVPEITIEPENIVEPPLPEPPLPERLPSNPTPIVRPVYEPREWELEPVFTSPPVTRPRALRTSGARGSGTRMSGRRLLAGIIAVFAIVGIGTATAVAVTGDDGGSADRPMSLADSSSESADADPTYADPADFAEARQPAARYVAPPPPPPPTAESTTEAPSQQQPRPRPRPRPRQRTIPNPIPGLPPIVLPG
ncbi:hypothetical protein [Gordonia insulae]|uniref:Uncharacterized protein n=1 Tax=Gordonia insulae TaxID=2420509 RepID=A0A3G8JSN2_9ACTN|nr:hypothetical protein [Gordonia insulae]AZG47569.1 hypothetical protein D7316_04181 [Gordonia insulae]